MKFKYLLLVCVFAFFSCKGKKVLLLNGVSTIYYMNYQGENLIKEINGWKFNKDIHIDMNANKFMLVFDRANEVNYNGDFNVSIKNNDTIVEIKNSNWNKINGVYSLKTYKIESEPYQDVYDFYLGSDNMRIISRKTIPKGKAL